ncbi:MAG TPA: O-antigen ligase family protein [Candidatus Magasanikbacteria bacterium]|nr:O-antigen ligase family protein [Candidatus Magasanikbacteria bacterium]
MNKFVKFLSFLVIFLFPFQTRLIYKPAYLGGYYFEWFSQSLSGIEILIWLIVIITFFRLISNKTFWLDINQARDKKERIMKIIRPALFLFFLVLYLFVAPLNRELAEYKIFLLLGVACFSLTLLINKIPFWQILMVLWGGGIVQSFLAIEQFVFQRTWENKWLGLAEHYPSDLGAAVLQATDGGRWLRAYGSFGWPNDLGFYLSLAFIVGLFLYGYFPKIKEKMFISVGQLLIITGLFFSFSRASFIALLSGLIIWLLMEKAKNWKILIPPLILILILSTICLPLWQSRILAENRLETRAISERFDQYKDFSEIFLAHPILGVGPGNYVYALFSQKLILTPWIYQPVHNVYLLFLAEWGIIGALVILCLAFYFFREVFKNNKAILPLWIIVLTAFFFDHYFYTTYSGMIILAFLTSASLIKKEV